MMYKVVLIVSLIFLSSCQANLKQKSDQTVYKYDNPDLTHTTYLGPAPAVRNPLVEDE